MSTALMMSLPTDATFRPCLAIGRELARRGERVVCYASRSLEAHVTEAGLEFRVLPFEARAVRTTLAEEAAWRLRVAVACMPDLIAGVEELRPDYLIVDAFCTWGRMVAQHVSVPTVAIHATSPAPFVALASTPPLAVTLMSQKLSRAGWSSFFEFRGLAAHLAASWEVERLTHPVQTVLPWHADLHMVATSPRLDRDGAETDPRYQYVGPCVREPLSPQPLPPLDERPLVYLSLGAFLNGRPEFQRKCLEAYADAPMVALMSVPASFSAAGLGALPDNVQLISGPDPITVLSRASVFVSDGGANGVCEALLAGVPMLLYPHGLDQSATARMVASLGAGVSGRWDTTTPEQIRALTEQLIACPPYHDRCEELGASLRAEGGAPRAAELILTFGEEARLARSAPQARLDVAENLIN